jgi:hypothetical protein
LNWLIDQLQTAFLQKYYIFSGIAWMDHFVGKYSLHASRHIQMM